jgi:DNA-binding response OmpR family regulator
MSASPQTPRVLVVEDMPTTLMLYCRGLIAAGFAVDKAADAAVARLAISRRTYAVVVLDKALGDGSGVDLLKAFRAAGGTAPALFLTADSTARGVQECLQAGAQDYLVKPVDIPTLAARVRRLVARGPLARPVRAAPAFGPAVA